ncbi:MAG: nitronate monooxygenase [Mycobacterium sp.]|jgi:nitronate monooxygenase|nr:nitronate monooxygenase [Mycobacterium sp.]
MTFDARDLALPIVGAPMAGGPGTPALAAAVSNAGGLGFLAAGLLRPGKLADDIAAVRAASTGPLGVNLFVPQPSVASGEDLAAYATRLQPVADRYGVEVGHQFPDDDAWDEKLELVADLRPDAVSFTFGTPDRDTISRLRGLGVLTLMTVTSADEARVALDLGADMLIAQGPRAGGHRGTLDPAATPPDEPLELLLTRIVQAANVPVIAAGGLSSPDDVQRVLRLGAVAAQVGTALLLSDEAGTNPVHRAALRNPLFTATAATPAFTGRYARGLLNDFAAAYGASAPLSYPHVGQITAPIRAASIAAGDPQAVNLWAGTEFHTARSGDAGSIIAALGAAAN